MKSSVGLALKKTEKGKLQYNNYINLDDQVNYSSSSLFDGIAETLANLSIKSAGEVSDEIDYIDTKKDFDLKKKIKFEINDSIYSDNSKNQESTSYEKLFLYENKLQNETNSKIIDLVYNLNNQLNEINEESFIKLSQIRQNSFINKLKWLERYNNETDDLFNQVTSKSSKYLQDESVKIKLEKVEKERLEIQNEIFKRKLKKLKEVFIKANNIFDEESKLLQNKNIPFDQIKTYQFISLLKDKINSIYQKNDSIVTDVILDEAKDNLDNLIKLVDLLKNEIEDYEKNNKLEVKTSIQNDIPKNNKSSFEGFVSENDLKNYIELRKFKMSLEESIKQFSEDPKYKNYKTNLTLFIKTTVNTLSNNSMEHINEKIDNYTKLFSGKQVQFRGNFLSINEHKDAFNFCIYHTAKSFLTTGIIQVIASTKTAYSFSLVMVALLIKFENFGKILLAFFFEMCPYTVPFYPQKNEQENEQNYLITCGYSLTKDGKTLEEKSVYLNKMRAIMKLYAAIIQTNLPNNPLNLNFGWKWLASILNLEPQESISPAILHSFLSITDQRFKNVYGKQFLKIIVYIKNIYISKLNNIKTDIPQAKVQLETYIDELMKTIY